MIWHGGRRLAAWAGALALVASVVRAGDQTQEVGNTSVEVRVRSAWPKQVSQGLAPLRVELRNNSGKVRDLRLEATSWDWNVERSLESRLSLAPGETSELELLLPVDSNGQSQYWLQVVHGDEQAYFGDCVGSSSLAAGTHPVLFVSERALPAGELEAWAEGLGDPLPTYTSGPGGVASAHTPDIELAQARHEELVRQWGAYTSLDLVVLDADHGLPSAERLAPLVAWVRSGGELLVIGERAREEALRAPELASWMEPRFAVPSPRGEMYRCGLGRLALGEGSDDPRDFRELVRAQLDARAQPAPKIQGLWRGQAADPRIPGLEVLPFRTFALILLGFALLIGPVNFLFVRNRKRPVLLLLTIPALSLVTTLLLLGYGILFQGLEVKVASVSVALLDERAHRSSSLEVRQLFAGLAPDEGLAPGAGTVVCAMPRRDLDRARLVLEHGEGLLLKGDYLPSRLLVEQMLGCERAERARLGVTLVGERLTIDNNLGAELIELVVRAPDGRLYVSAEGLEAGESVQLAPAANPVNAEALVETLHGRALPLSSSKPQSSEEYLPPGCYLASMRASPFRDACGIEQVELAGTHVLFGVLPLDEEAWR